VPVERHDGRQILEQVHEAALGQTPGSVGDVAFEELPDHGPRRLEQHPPGRSERVGHAVRRLGGEKHAHGAVVHIPPVQSSLDLCTSRPRGRLPDPVQLFVDVREVGGRWHGEEVGQVARVRKEREKQPEIVIAMKTLHDVAPLSEPQEVGCVSNRTGDRAGGSYDLAQRRYAEAAVEDAID
jgi:hypothetical protein